MGRVTTICCVLVLLAAAAAAAEDRLAVLEFFGRPSGQYCQDAAPAVIALQGEMAGRALLLEYDYDAFRTGRVGRWFAAYQGGGTVYLPLVMVGSGYRVTTGPVDYSALYRSMLEAELARPPAAGVEAYSRQTGQALRVYVRVTNRSEEPLRPDEGATVWVLLWEDARLGLTDTWVRGTVAQALATALEPGESATMTVDVTPVSAVDWGRVRSVALIEHRPPDGERYDMLQAAVAVPAAFQVTPGQVSLSSAEPSTEVLLAGPHVLGWTATLEVPWLEVAPAAGNLPAAVTVCLRGDVMPPGPQATSIRFDASGDGMSYSATVQVSAEGPRDPYAPRRVRGRFGSPGAR